MVLPTGLCNLLFFALIKSFLLLSLLFLLVLLLQWDGAQSYNLKQTSSVFKVPVHIVTTLKTIMYICVF